MKDNLKLPRHQKLRCSEKTKIMRVKTFNAVFALDDKKILFPVNRGGKSPHKKEKEEKADHLVLQCRHHCLLDVNVLPGSLYTTATQFSISATLASHL